MSDEYKVHRMPDKQTLCDFAIKYRPYIFSKIMTSFPQEQEDFWQDFMLALMRRAGKKLPYPVNLMTIMTEIANSLTINSKKRQYSYKRCVILSSVSSALERVEEEVNSLPEENLTLKEIPGYIPLEEIALFKFIADHGIAATHLYLHGKCHKNTRQWFHYRINRLQKDNKEHIPHKPKMQEWILKLYPFITDTAIVIPRSCDYTSKKRKPKNLF